MELRRKTDELTNSSETDNINPHVLCFSEHDMEEQDLLHFTKANHHNYDWCTTQNLSQQST